MAGEGLRVGQRRFDVGVAVVASDMLLELLPQSLDGVRLGRVGRQEVRHHAPAETRGVALGLLRPVDDIVLGHDMKDAGAAVGAAQALEEADEEARVFGLPPVYSTCPVRGASAPARWRLTFLLAIRTSGWWLRSM